jgi:hypothetical protein
MSNHNSSNSRFTGFPSSNNQLNSSLNSRAPLPGGAARQTSSRYGRDEEDNDDRLPAIRSRNYPPTGTAADLVGGGGGDGGIAGNSRVSFSNDSNKAVTSSSLLYGRRKSNRGSLEDDHPDVDGVAKQMETTGFGGTNNNSSSNDSGSGSGVMGGAYTAKALPSSDRSLIEPVEVCLHP